MLPAVSGAESFHRGRAGAARAVLHQPRRPRLRADQPAGDGQGRAVRALFALGQVAAAALPRRVRGQGHAGGAAAPEAPSTSAAVERAERLYARVFSDYGDDSVAQLGGAHIACEYVSNVLTKVLEWGRLMSYLEQSTRYVPYTDRLHGRWRYHVPAELDSRRAARPIRAHDGCRVRVLRRVDPAHAGVLRRAPPARRARLRGACTAPPSGRRRSTHFAACCPRRRSRTSDCSAAARRSSRCCCACARIRCSRCAPAPTRCSSSCARSSRRF